jgi:hypothetical protein
MKLRSSLGSLMLRWEPTYKLRCFIIIISSSLKVGHHGLFRFGILTSEIYEYIWTFGRTPWTGDQPDARPLSTQDNITQKNADTHICASGGIQTHDPSVRTVEDCTCLRPRGHWDRDYDVYKIFFLPQVSARFCLCSFVE